MTVSARRWRRAFLVVVTVLAASLPIGAARSDTSLSHLVETGRIRGAFANEAPYGYVDGDGRLTGESPEVARVVFGQAGIGTLAGVLTEWAALLDGLEDGRWDVVVAGMFITPERCARADFSNPSYKMGHSLLVPAGNPHDLHSYEDVAARSGVVLGVLAGAVEGGYAAEAGVPDSRIQPFPDQLSLLSAVKTGRIGAAALTAASVERMAREGGPSVESVRGFRTPDAAVGYGGFAFPRGSGVLVEVVNAHLNAFIGTQQHLDLVARFGFTDANLPGDVTAKQLCAGERPRG